MLTLPHNFRLPSYCLLCHTLQRKPYAVCDVCMRALPKLGFTCINCATPMVWHKSHRCSNCRLQKPILDRIFTAYRFEEPLRSLLHEFKYQEGLYLTPLITALMQEALPIHYTTECLIPIPMHAKRLQQRGFNQAQLLAKRLAKHLQRPCVDTKCEKIFDTSHQTTLNALERRQNLKNSFLVKPLPYHHVTLIDDLITTGSTATELARCLKKAGVQRVDLWCCAKACIREHL